MHPERIRAPFRFTAFAALIFVSACVTSDQVLDQKQRSSLRHIAIHAVEPPPLTVPTTSMVTSSHLKPFEDLTASEILVGMLLLGAIPVSEDTRKEAELYEAYARALETSDVWIPTRFLARAAEIELKEIGVYRTELVSSVLKLYSGGKRDRLDKYGPVRSWYNTNDTLPAGVTTVADAVLQIGLLNFELVSSPGHTRQTFFVQVLARLVDARTGKVLARAREYTYGVVPGMRRLFADDAEAFKETFENTTAPLVRRCLSTMGLL